MAPAFVAAGSNAVETVLAAGLAMAFSTHGFFDSVRRAVSFAGTNFLICRGASQLICTAMNVRPVYDVAPKVKIPLRSRYCVRVVPVW